MKIKELIEKLQQYNQECDVLCYSEDEYTLATGHGFRLFDITDINVSVGVKTRGDDKIPSIKFERGENSQEHFFLDVTGDF